MNILIIKTGALGDVVRTSFIAQALKDKYSNKKPYIYWITDNKAQTFFINNPYVDEVLTQEKRNLLKDKEFDLIINLEEDEENCKFTSHARAKERIGFLYENGDIVPSQSTREWFDMSLLGKKPYNDILKKRNKKTHGRLIAEIANIDYKKYEPFLRLTKEQRNFAKDFLRRHNLSKTELIIGINTGAADRWPKSLSIKNTVSIIDRLYKKYKSRFILFGGPNEIERNKEILRKVSAPVIDAGCGNDLMEFPALLSVCSLVITSDSLGLHIALALKRKTICLVGPTSPTELDMYGLGEKVIANSSCICCYKKDCKSMEKISLKKILSAVNKLLQHKITLVITAFKEPHIGRAIEAALKQETKKKYEIIVSAPDKETISIVRRYALKDKKVKLFKDPGKGKSYALNLILKKISTDILILTDGDVWISRNAVEDIANMFLDPEVGCVTGRPVPQEDRKTKYGYWANFLFEAAHNIRKKAHDFHNFIECSGYLFAFRKDKVGSIPLDVAEDSIIPYYFWEKGYSIGYAEKAEVYVKNSDNLKDWLKQKTRTSKAHETLAKYVDTEITPRVKTFINETKGADLLFSYPKTLKEFIWTIQLAGARAFMWIKVFVETRLSNSHYSDAWERVESTK